uniref:Lipase n=1 Tax=uncultured Planctomycetota bacterium TaxID=120965 RepID=H5SCC7_9BACT|nr:lipase [uncultured Planctomycetota bacterium]
MLNSSMMLPATSRVSAMLSRIFWAFLLGLVCVSFLKLVWAQEKRPPEKAQASKDAASADQASRHWPVEAHKDLLYYDGPDKDDQKHRLDLYLPKGAKGYPVLVFVHGGAWMFGDRNFFFGMYERLGRTFARHGVGAAVMSYRLSPAVKHPEHARDVARAVGWVHRNIARYSGDPWQIVLCGHSAGGHLVALVGLDTSYLQAEQVPLQAIRALVPISGVYQIPPQGLTRVFDADPQLRQNASPIHHVRKNAPPCLLAYAERDLPGCDQMSEALASKLRAAGNVAELCKLPDRDHNTIIFFMGRDEDPAFQAVLAFLRKQVRIPAPPQP